MRWLRTSLAATFMLFMLASGHLLMVAVNAAEVAVEHPGSAPSGVAARLFTDLPLSEELRAAHARTRHPQQQAILAAGLASVERGEPLVLETLPVTPFLAWAAMALTLAGLVLIWLTSRLRSDAAQSIVGIFGGNLIWTGAVEYGLTLAARTFGIAKTVAVVDGRLVAVFGEYVLLKHTWGAMVLIVAYIAFLESSRCPVFLWWRRRVPSMRGALVTGRIDNYGPRTAFQYSTTVWGSYLLLLWAYDEQLFGVHGRFTTAVFLLSLGGTVYVLWRLHQHDGWGPAVRYAIGATIVAWTAVEIAGKWGLFREPWLLLQPLNVVVFFGGLGVGTWWLWRAQVEQRQ